MSTGLSMQTARAPNTCPAPTDGHSGLSLCQPASGVCVEAQALGWGEGSACPICTAPLWASGLPPPRTEMLQPPRAPGVRQAGARSPTLPVSPHPSPSGSFQPARPVPGACLCFAHPGGDPVCWSWCVSDIQLGGGTGGSCQPTGLFWGEHHHGYLRMHVTSCCVTVPEDGGETVRG